jgi:hypothetical protein
MTNQKFRTKHAIVVQATPPTPSRRRQATDFAQVTSLVRELGVLIEGARKQVAGAANAVLTLLHSQISDRVHLEVLKQRRASRHLEKRYGRGFNEKSLRRMVQFASGFPDAKIVATLSRQLGWSHFVDLIPIKDPLKRDFYGEMCRMIQARTP